MLGDISCGADPFGAQAETIRAHSSADKYVKPGIFIAVLLFLLPVLPERFTGNCVGASGFAVKTNALCVVATRFVVKTNALCVVTARFVVRTTRFAETITGSSNQVCPRLEIL